jgi:hypothetical protein
LSPRGGEEFYEGGQYGVDLKNKMSFVVKAIDGLARTGEFMGETNNVLLNKQLIIFFLRCLGDP